MFVLIGALALIGGLLCGYWAYSALRRGRLNESMTYEDSLNAAGQFVRTPPETPVMEKTFGQKRSIKTYREEVWMNWPMVKKGLHEGHPIVQGTIMWVLLGFISIIMLLLLAARVL